MQAETAAGAPFPKQFRRKYARSKQGCLQCRVRRKKCDQGKPNCAACASKRQTCSWPESSVSHDRAPPESDGRHSTSIAASQGGALIEWPQTNVAAFMVHPVLQSAVSRRLFQNYVYDTSRMVTTKPADENSFLTTLLPLAATDELTMHVVLALSGAQLNYQNEAATEIGQATALHYRITLNSLREAVGKVSTSTTEEEWLRLSLVLALLCLVEAFIGNETHGSIFPHLRALHHFVPKLLSPDFSIQQHTSRQQQRTLILESYAYFTVVSNIVPQGLMPERHLPQDTISRGLDYLKATKGSGTLFCCGFTLFELITPTASLAARAIRHQEQYPNQTNGELEATYQSLLDRVLLAQYPFGGHIDTVDPMAQRCAGELYRSTLLIWLKVAIWRSHAAGNTILAQVQGHIDASLLMLDAVLNSAYGTVALWTIVVLGSCLTREEDKKLLDETLSLQTSKWRFNVVPTVRRLLSLLPPRHMQEADGPHELMRVMQKHDINLCMV